MHLERRFPAASDAPRAARMTVTMMLRDHAAASAIDDAELATSELVTNSVRHARAPDAGIGLTADLEGDVLRVAVTDGGRGFDPSRAADAPGVDGGWGLQLLGRIADEWGIVAGPPTTVWFEMRLHGGVVPLVRGP